MTHPPQEGGLLLHVFYPFIMSDLFIAFDRFLTENALLLNVEGVRYSVNWSTLSPYFCDLTKYR